MPTSIPQPVQVVVNTYINLVNDALPGLLDGLYLHGSVALGAFNLGLSDIDAMTITSRRCTPSDIATLRHHVHHTLGRRYPNIQWEGSYLQWSDLGQFDDAISPHPYTHDGVLHASGYHDINAVTWWILKHRGIAVIGPAPNQFDFEVDWDALVDNMHRNLNSYWACFTTNPRRMTWLLTDYGVQWTVLGMLRQFYTFREHAITSKTGAGRYSLAHTPQQWHKLIHEAIAIREGPYTSAYHSAIARAVMARAFLQLIIVACHTTTA